MLNTIIGLWFTTWMNFGEWLAYTGLIGQVLILSLLAFVGVLGYLAGAIFKGEKSTVNKSKI